MLGMRDIYGGGDSPEGFEQEQEVVLFPVVVRCLCLLPSLVAPWEASGAQQV